MSAADTITAATAELAGLGYSSLVHADLTAHARSGPVKRWRVCAVYQLATLAVLVAVATVIAAIPAWRMRRAVPGMSWRLAWALTAPEVDR